MSFNYQLIGSGGSGIYAAFDIHQNWEVGIMSLPTSISLNYKEILKTPQQLHIWLLYATV